MLFTFLKAHCHHLDEAATIFLLVCRDLERIDQVVAQSLRCSVRSKHFCFSAVRAVLCDQDSLSLIFALSCSICGIIVHFRFFLLPLSLVSSSTSLLLALLGPPLRRRLPSGKAIFFFIRQPDLAISIVFAWNQLTSFLPMLPWAQPPPLSQCRHGRPDWNLQANVPECEAQILPASDANASIKLWLSLSTLASRVDPGGSGGDIFNAASALYFLRPDFPW